MCDKSNHKVTEKTRVNQASIKCPVDTPLITSQSSIKCPIKAKSQLHQGWPKTNIHFWDTNKTNKKQQTERHLRQQDNKLLLKNLKPYIICIKLIYTLHRNKERMLEVRCPANKTNFIQKIQLRVVERYCIKKQREYKWLH